MYMLYLGELSFYVPHNDMCVLKSTVVWSALIRLLSLGTCCNRPHPNSQARHKDEVTDGGQFFPLNKEKWFDHAIASEKLNNNNIRFLFQNSHKKTNKQHHPLFQNNRAIIACIMASNFVVLDDVILLWIHKDSTEGAKNKNSGDKVPLRPFMAPGLLTAMA